MSKDLKTGEPTSTPVKTETVATPPAAAAAANPTPPADSTNKADGKGATQPDPSGVGKSGDNSGNPPVVPEKYELKLRKDSPLTSDVAEIEANAKALGLSQEQAQKMVESRESDFDKFNQRQQEAYKTQQSEWRKTAETDVEIAGADGKAFKENIELAHRALEKFADPAFKKTLNDTGLGNHPELIKTFLRIGKGMANDKSVLDGKMSPPGKKVSREEKLFPTHYAKKE